jgi:hypothetical protein
VIISNKLIVTGAAGLVGVALVVGGVLSGTGAFSTPDASGRVLQMTGVGPVSAHASATARPRGTATTHSATRATTHAPTRATQHTVTHNGVGQVAPPAAQPLPSYHAVLPSPSPVAPPAAPQPAHHAPSPAHSSPGPVHGSPDMHLSGH